MPLPLIAIVGRPNVGKSTLLNALAGRRISVVDPTEGVTRDRISARVERDGRVFEIMDTGGIGIVDRQDLDVDVERQISAALDAATCVIFVTDARAGVTPLDKKIARRLHETGKPVVFAANKTESERLRQSLDEFRSLGFGLPVPLSAQNLENTSEVLALAIEHLPDDAPEAAPQAHIKVAIVGRQNAGKSTLVNALANDNRVIVSEKAGTTRDAVDVWIERDGKHWVLIDTAGFTRTAHNGRDPIQWYSEHRALRAIRYCDVAVLLLDVNLNVGGLEKRLADAILEAGKPCLLVANKWDLVTDNVPTGKFDEYFRGVLSGLRRAPLAFISAKNRMNVQRMLDVCAELHEQAGYEIPTGELNRFIEHALSTKPPRIRSGRRARVYYATQVGTHPPSMALFVNDPDLFDPSFRRYVENLFRDTYPVREVPVKFDFRRRERKSLGDLKGGL